MSIFSQVGAAVSQAVSSAITSMVNGLVTAGINYLATKAAQGIAKSVGGNFGAVLGQLAGGAISAGLGGAATSILNDSFGENRFKIGGTFGFNTEQVVGLLVGAAGNDLANYVQKKVGGYAGFALANIISAASGAAQATLFQREYTYIDRQYIAEFGNANLAMEEFRQALSLGNYRFPQDLSERYWIRFWFKAYNRLDMGARARYTGGESIRLPIPSNLVDNYSIQYNAVSMGALGGLGADKISEIMRMSEAGSSTPEDFYRTGRAINEVIFSAEMGAYLTRRLVSGLSDSVQTAIDQVSGNILNPYVTQAFQGVNLKNHSFTWKFAPQSPEESNALKFILNRFKFHSAPVTSNGGLRLQYPSLVFVELFDQGYMFAFKPCFITSININYAPSGVPTFFKGTRAPTEVEFTLNLSETAIQDRQFVASQGGDFDVVLGYTDYSRVSANSLYNSTGSIRA